MGRGQGLRASSRAVENIPEPSIPESFKVLLKEMQSLALDVKVVSEDGGDVVVRGEEDELLRAAEELGIDLQPLPGRVAARDPEAQEVEEGADPVDAEGELTVANDEALPEEFDEDGLGQVEEEGVAPDEQLERIDIEV